MHLNQESWIDATSIGFGCPPVLDLLQSESVKDNVYTVVMDADVVPRLSGASIINAFRDVACYDWTAKGLEDLELLLDWLKLPNKKGILQWADGIMNTFDRPFFGNVSRDREPLVLYPPGTCIHAYRDGVGFTSTYTPCSLFDSVELSRNMVFDHLIPTGYHKAFLELLRGHRNDLQANFPHDLMALTV